MAAIILSLYFMHTKNTTVLPNPGRHFPSADGVSQGMIAGNKYFAEVVCNTFMVNRGRDDPPPEFTAPYLRVRLQYAIKNIPDLRGTEGSKGGIEPKGVFVASYAVSLTKADSYTWEQFLSNVKMNWNNTSKSIPSSGRPGFRKGLKLFAGSLFGTQQIANLIFFFYLYLDICSCQPIMRGNYTNCYAA